MLRDGAILYAKCPADKQVQVQYRPFEIQPDQTMSETETRDFIRQIIQDDLASGKHKEIVTRFPPEPNGYLHIGHVMSVCLNFGVSQRDERPHLPQAR